MRKKTKTDRQKVHPGARALWPDTLPHSYLKGGELVSRKIHACCMLPAVFKKQTCRTKQRQGLWGNLMECCTSVLGKHRKEEGEHHTGWSVHCGPRALTGGCLQALWENPLKRLVYSFFWSHMAQLSVDTVCVREWTGVSRLWGYVFPFQMPKKPSGNSTEGQKGNTSGLHRHRCWCKSRGGSGRKVRLCRFSGWWTERRIGTLLWNSPGVSKAPYPALTYSCPSQNPSVGSAAAHVLDQARLLLVSVRLLCITWKGLSTNWVQAGGLCCQLVTLEKIWEGAEKIVIYPRRPTVATQECFQQRPLSGSFLKGKWFLNRWRTKQGHERPGWQINAIRKQESRH